LISAVRDGVEQRSCIANDSENPVSFVILDDPEFEHDHEDSFVQEATLSVLDSDEQQERYRDEFSVYGIAPAAKNLVPSRAIKKTWNAGFRGSYAERTGSTALFDGIYLGISEARERAENKHRAMILFPTRRQSQSL